jgi:hypothetical protein
VSPSKVISMPRAATGKVARPEPATAGHELESIEPAANPPGIAMHEDAARSNAAPKPAANARTRAARPEIGLRHKLCLAVRLIARPVGRTLPRASGAQEMRARARETKFAPTPLSGRTFVSWGEDGDCKQAKSKAGAAAGLSAGTRTVSDPSCGTSSLPALPRSLMACSRLRLNWRRPAPEHWPKRWGAMGAFRTGPSSWDWRSGPDRIALPMGLKTRSEMRGGSSRAVAPCLAIEWSGGSVIRACQASSSITRAGRRPFGADTAFSARPRAGHDARPRTCQARPPGGVWQSSLGGPVGFALHPGDETAATATASAPT